MIMEQAHENKMTRDETLKVALMVGKILLKKRCGNVSCRGYY